MKDLRERLAAQGVHTLIAQFTDLHGIARGKFVPLAHLDDLLTEGMGFSGPSIAGTGLPRCGPRSEYWARGAASTAVALPFPQPGPTEPAPVTMATFPCRSSTFPHDHFVARKPDA